MSIKDLSIKVDGAIAITAGTETTILEKRQSLTEKRVIIDDGADFLAQTLVDFKAVDPIVNSSSPNGYTQARTKIHVQIPHLLANAKYTTNTMDFSLAVDPEVTDAEIRSMRTLMVALIDSAFLDALFNKQSLS